MPCRKGLNDKGGGTLEADVSNEKFGHPRCLCHVFFRGWCHYVLPIFCIGDYFINPEISDPIIKKDPGCLAYIGDYTYYTTQLRITISQCKDPISKPPVFHELQVSVRWYFFGVPNWQLLGPKSRPNWGTMVGDSVRPLRKPYLGGGWTNPFEKILVRQKWIISPLRFQFWKAECITTWDLGMWWTYFFGQDVFGPQNFPKTFLTTWTAGIRRCWGVTFVYNVENGIVLGKVTL